MPRSEIIVTLFTIIYGLMLADLFISLHKLLRRKSVVRWHWLPLLTAWYLFLVILKNWWGLIASFDDMAGINILYFIAYGHLLALLFLLASAALPEKIPPSGIDMKDYYFANSRYFWGLMCGVIVLATAIGAIRHPEDDPGTAVAKLALTATFLTLNVVMAASRRLRVHAVLLGLFIIMLGGELYGLFAH